MNNLKALREKLGLSQYEFSKRLNVPATTISRWERGEQVPLPHHAAHLAFELHVTEPELGLAPFVGPGRPRLLREA